MRPAPLRKPTLSPTKISTFLECAVKYRYVYIDKIGKFYLKSRAGFSFGSTLHHVLQSYHEQGAVLTVDQMVEGLNQSWISAGYESAEQERQHLETGVEIVTAYHTAYQRALAGSVETIATEKTISCDMGRYKLTGRVDRIDRHGDGTLEVVDYKSGRLSVTPEEVASSIAMSCYQLILKHLYPEADIRGTIYCLRSGESATYGMDSVALNEFERDISRIADAILDMGWDTVRPERIEACSDCDFLSRCSTYWRNLDRMRAQQDGEFSDQGL